MLWGTFAFSLCLTILIIYVPFLRDLFSFTFIDAKEFATAAGIAILIIPIVEIAKFIQRRMNK